MVLRYTSYDFWANTLIKSYCYYVPLTLQHPSITMSQKGSSSSQSGAPRRESRNIDHESSDRYKPRPDEAYEWTRILQGLVFDHGKGAGRNGFSYLLPLRFPPTVEGFKGFVYIARGSLGIPLAAPPFKLVGVVIEVTVNNFEAKNLSGFPHLEPDIALPTPLAKLVYAIMEDSNGVVHAMSLTTLKPNSIIRGLPDNLFQIAGFPKGVSHTRDQGLVMGIPLYRDTTCIPNTFPLMQLGWETFYEAGRENFKEVQLLVRSDVSAYPGSWLSYKVPDAVSCGGYLAQVRRDFPVINDLYILAGAKGVEYGDPTIPTHVHNLHSLRRYNTSRSPNPYQIRAAPGGPDAEEESDGEELGGREAGLGSTG